MISARTPYTKSPLCAQCVANVISIRKPGRVTVPHPNKDIPRGTVASINRQAGWKA